MPAFEHLPPPSTPTFLALLGLILLFWLGMRVNILRRLAARRPPEEPPPDVPAWLRSLAAWPGTYPALALVAAGLVALLLV